MQRWLVACLVFCATACHPNPSPNPQPGSPDALCKRVPVTGTATLGASYVHAAAFQMLVIESCGFDMSKLLDAARTCRDQGSCGVPVTSGMQVIDDAANGTWTTVALGGGRAFQTKVGERSIIAWDTSRDPMQVLSSVGQGASGAAPEACCPGCTACDAGAGTPACPAGGGTPPQLGVFPAPGFPDEKGPAVCSCSDVCAARAKLPADCDCATLCRCK
jgi:hypothetical protein